MPLHTLAITSLRNRYGACLHLATCSGTQLLNCHAKGPMDGAFFVKGGNLEASCRDAR